MALHNARLHEVKYNTYNIKLSIMKQNTGFVFLSCINFMDAEDFLNFDKVLSIIYW